jgi:putative molybdopterin biosynthesis protein
MERNIYLSNTDIEDAVALYLEKLGPAMDRVATELVDIREARGRTTSAPVIARLSSPNHNAAAMDGIMVISDRTFTASEANPVILERGADFEYINTGHRILEPYDSVIMIEDVVVLNETQVKIMVQAAPWQHIRPIGEDIVAGEMILPENIVSGPWISALSSAAGLPPSGFMKKIRVGIIPTGNEIRIIMTAWKRERPSTPTPGPFRRSWRSWVESQNESALWRMITKS